MAEDDLKQDVKRAALDLVAPLTTDYNLDFGDTASAIGRALTTDYRLEGGQIVAPTVEPEAAEPIEAYSAEAVPEEQRLSPELTGKPTDNRLKPLMPQAPVAEGLRTTVAGGKGGLSGTVEGTVGPQVNPALYAAQAEVAARSAAIQKLGLQAQADAIGLQIDVMREIEPLWEADFEHTREQVQGLLDEAQEGTDAIAGMIEAAQSDQINPGQFFANVGGAGRFAAAMAVGVGAMATAFGGGPNVALGIIQSAIDRNVRAQLANQQHNRALIGHQVNYINTLRGIASNRQEFSNYLRLGYTALAQSQFAQISAGLAQSQALLAKHDVDNRLQAMLVDSQIKAQEALRQKVTFKFKTMAQYGQAMRALGNRPALGTGGGAAPLATRSAKRGVPAIDYSKVTTVEELKAEFKRASAEGMSEAQIAQERERFAAHQETAGNSGMAEQIRALGRHDLLHPSANNPVTISVGDVKGTAYANERFLSLTPNQQREQIERVSKIGTAYANARELSNLLDVGGLGTREKWTQHFRRVLGKGYARPLADPAAQSIISKMDSLSFAIEEYARQQQGTRNAINTAAEILRSKQANRTGLTLGDALVDLFVDNAALRKARFAPTVDEMRKALSIIESSSGLTIQWQGE